MKRFLKKVKKSRRKSTPERVCSIESSEGSEESTSSYVESGFEDLETDSEVDSCGSSRNSFRKTTKNNTSSNAEKEKRGLEFPCTTGEVTGENKSGKYDVLLVCSMKDRKKVVKLVTYLEKLGLKVCLPQRDLLVGLSLPMVIPELIMNRCRYTILCLSPSFFDEKECLFHAEIVHWLSAGELKKKAVTVKLEEYEAFVTKEQSGFQTLFHLAKIVDLSNTFNLSEDLAWEFGALLNQIRSQ